MAKVTFQVLEGIDKGRLFRELATPVTIGREEGNSLRLNDERVSRYHAKVQADNGEIIITDLESTNGTRVNNVQVQIRRLRPGDCVNVGRTLLRFGSDDEISARMQAIEELSAARTNDSNSAPPGAATIQAHTLAMQFNHDVDFELNARDKMSSENGTIFIGNRPLPPLPEKMSPSQAARLAELLDFMHRHLTAGTENIQCSDDGLHVTLGFNQWQRVLAVQMLLARYVRAVAEPEVLEE